MSKIKHVLGISGGKDSAALAIYMNKKYPEIDFVYYFCDTGKELDETYQLVKNLEIYLGKEITKLKAKEPKQAGKNPFFHLMIPEAVIRFRQGFGRLIRSGIDRGIIVVMDNRLHKARYGHYFIKSVPVKLKVARNKDALFHDILSWFQNDAQ